METTLNMRTDIMQAVAQAAKSRGVTRSEIIIFLIKKVMENIPDALPMGTMVRYQKRRRPEAWKVIHVRVAVYEYEYMTDLRKLLKMSVSLICAYAVQKYLKKPLRRRITDNYPFFMNYMVAKDIIDNFISWRIIWGFTPNIERHILQEKTIT
jgi:hypothetical protein